MTVSEIHLQGYDKKGGASARSEAKKQKQHASPLPDKAP